MPFKEGGSTRDMLLGSLMLEQYGSIRRYSARQSYAGAVRKHEKISLVQRRAPLKQACTEACTGR
jgi:hypothetical protein